MKKILATVMALALLISTMAISAAAAYYPEGSAEIAYDGALATDNDEHGGGKENNPKINSGETVGTGSVDVNIQTGDGNTFTNVYAICYSTTELNFTYGSGLSYIWNPEKLAYEIDSTVSGNWTPSSNTITVTNYSDLPVDVEATYAKGVDVAEDVSVSLNSADTTAELNLAAAATNPNNASSAGEAKSGTITVAVSGDLTKAYSKTTLGTITMTIKAAE